MIWVIAVPVAKRRRPSHGSGMRWNQKTAKTNSSRELTSKPTRDAGSVVGSAAVPRRMAPTPQVAASDASRTRRSYVERDIGSALTRAPGGLTWLARPPAGRYTNFEANPPENVRP